MVAAGKKLQEERGQAAGVELHNELVRRGGPGNVTKEDIDALAQRFGISFSEKQLPELQQAYGLYLEALIPQGDTPLSGDEPRLVADFKGVLGLEDKAAAEVHMNLARRLLREKAEQRKGGGAEQRKAFQKLIYVSYQVFGAQKASFLLPFARTLGINPGGIDIANREVAKQLFQNFLVAAGGELPAERAPLAELKQYQDRISLKDDVAEEALQEAARVKLERLLDSALECVKRRGRGRNLGPAMQALRELVDYNRSLQELAGSPDVPAGVGKTSVFGSKFAEGRSADLRLLYTTYLEETLRLENRFSQQLEQDLAELQTMLGLGRKECQKICDETSSKVYRRLLREEVTSGRLDAAPSKAAVLQGLCDTVKLQPEVAQALHKSLYKQKLDSLLEDKKLSDEDAKELERLRKLLCLQQADIDELHGQTCGTLFKEVLADALAAGIDNFTSNDRANVKRAKKDLRISDTLAKECLATQYLRNLWKIFLGFITRSRSQRDRLEGAKELKRLVFYSNIVVAPLLEDCNAEETEKRKAQEKAKKEIAELMVKAQDEAKASKNAPTEELAEQAETLSEEIQQQAEQKQAEAGVEDDPAEASASEQDDERPATLKKAQEAAAAREGVTMKSQKDINLAKDLDARDRQDIYRNFLLYCMSGNVVALPMGASVVVERDESEFARLSQLGDILGLNVMEVGQVHKELAEQAFRNQVQQVMSSGQLNQENTQYLTDMRDKMGLSKEEGEKIIKGVQNQRMGANLQAAKAQGSLSLEKVLEMKESGVDINSFVSEELRLELYSKEIARVLSSGTGDFDSHRILEQLPKDLNLPERRVAATLQAQGKDRKRTTLVQAVSHLRQRKSDEVVKSLNNLLACNKALPSEQSPQWNEREELQDMFSIYISHVIDEAKQADMQSLLGLSDKEADSLRDTVSSGSFKLDEEKDDDSFF
eukprot:jgi/Astpho2/3309/fgenesh1_pg.00054_%23_10_t